jgi:hypothetical protein
MSGAIVKLKPGVVPNFLDKEPGAPIATSGLAWIRIPLDA